MPDWTCPSCQRQFGKRNQSHECSPAMTLDEYFSTGPNRERPIFEAVMRALEPVGPVHVEPVSVGIFLKRQRTFVELRPKTKWVGLSFMLHRTIDHVRIARKIQDGNRTFHFVKLVGPDDVDEQVAEWLIESYLESPA